ncbi:MAG: GspE/PulE family protein [Patescibacteria group bacterium]
MGNDFSSVEDLLPHEEADDAIEKSATSKLKSKMSEITLKRKEEEAASTASQIGVPYMDLHGFPILTDAIKIIDKETAKEKKLVCFLRTNDQLRIGFTDQNMQQEVQGLAEQYGQRHNAHAAVYLISEDSYQTAMSFYELLPVKKEIKGGVEITEADIKKYQSEINEFEDVAKRIKGVNLSETVVIVLASAMKMNASDVHVEAAEKGVMIRFRIDGVLHDVAAIPSADWSKLIARLKLVAHLKLNVTTTPQDGRFTIFLTEDKVEVRVSTIPTAYGESVVMRLLRSSSVGLKFDDLGFEGRAYDLLQTQVQRPNGMIITTGPTGSGKTTTLYAILNLLNKPETKIITLEDPIEYKLEGINQSQIDAAREYTFAKGLRSILRQDPDIVMVGEIRDDETADIAVNAALTGHLVISTIHTNSAAGAIPRFVSMNVKPFLLAPALDAVIGQRLVRRVCNECKGGDELTSEQLERVKGILETLPEGSEERASVDFDNLSFYKGKGCEACHNLGYKGRIGLYEVLIVEDEIEKMILSNQVSEGDIQKIAQSKGMITMVQDGLLKALKGVTTVEEVFKQAE